MIELTMVVLVTLLSLGQPTQPPTREPCEGPDVDPWITDFRDRVVSYNELARHAIAQYGEPISCESAVTAEFDGARFGMLILGFSGGVALHSETMPPETSVTTLSSDVGFADEAEMRQVLERYTRGVGFAIDWTAPDVITEGSEVVHQYWDPDPGLNASASLVFSDGRLVAVRVSWAL